MLRSQDRPSSRTRGRRHWPHRLVTVVLIVAGILVSAWPVCETFRGNSDGSNQTTEYIAAIQRVSPEKLDKQLSAARQYNAELPAAALDDPWDGDDPEETVAHNRYLSLLDSTRAMGRIRIPAINVDLPVLHDADRWSMSFGVGHMYGSSLPVGGPGTHAVLAAHTGLRGRTMFDRLPQVKVGDTFTIEIAHKTLRYTVDHLTVVEPWDLEAVQRIPGGDYVTLVTCYTPPGSHKQRLLVRGTRAQESTSARVEGYAPAQATYDSSIQDWMWPRIAIDAAAVLALLALAVSWIVPSRTGRRAVAVVDTGAPQASRPERGANDH